MSLTSIVYRRVQKQAIALAKHYDNDFDKFRKALFGISIPSLPAHELFASVPQLPLPEPITQQKQSKKATGRNVAKGKSKTQKSQTPAVMKRANARRQEHDSMAQSTVRSYFRWMARKFHFASSLKEKQLRAELAKSTEASSLTDAQKEAKIKTDLEAFQHAIVKRDMDKAFWFLREAGKAAPCQTQDDNYLWRRAMLVFMDKASSNGTQLGSSEPSAAEKKKAHKATSAARRSIHKYLSEKGVLGLMPISEDIGPLPRHTIGASEPFWATHRRRETECPFVFDMLTMELRHMMRTLTASKPLAIIQTSDAPSAAASRKKKVSSSSSSSSSTPVPIAVETIQEVRGDSRCQLPTQTLTVSNNGLVEIQVRTKFVGVRDAPPVTNASNQLDISAAEEDDEGEADTEFVETCDEDGNITVHAISEGDESVDRSASSSAQHSAKQQNVFEYIVRITNVATHGNRHPSAADRPHVMVLSRHWNFVDLEHRTVQDVTGPGVVGEFPLLAPGESFTYTSGAGLFGEEGYMKGTLQMLVMNQGGRKKGKRTQIDGLIAATRLTTQPKKGAPVVKSIATEASPARTEAAAAKSEQ